MRLVGLNRQVIPASQASISVLDHGLLYGMGLFETFRTYDGVPFLLDRHLKRLEESCSVLGIPYTQDDSTFRDWLQALLAANDLKDAYVRYTVTAGEGGLGLPSGMYEAPQELLLVKPLPVMPDEAYLKGRGLQLLHTPRNTPETPVRLKSLHYMNSIIAKKELQSYPEAVALQAEGCMLTVNQELAEGIVSNLFFIREGHLYTPDIGTGILPGITRTAVLELAQQLSIPVHEGRYGWEDLLEADEVFTTGSVQELMPITSLLAQGQKTALVGSGVMGPITGQLLQAYRQWTGNRQEGRGLRG
ncbi:aminotransferase class IV [Paenibacillus sp. JSM ZJ436]|uniref:aminotransferase class IV n=1 Tax=Paenibacillus sp. JSM ZJ436 TaxID=3376190 RepID=UPI0037877EDF